MVREPFSKLVNIANRFLRLFNLETEIRSLLDYNFIFIDAIPRGVSVTRYWLYTGDTLVSW